MIQSFNFYDFFKQIFAILKVKGIYSFSSDAPSELSSDAPSELDCINQFRIVKFPRKAAHKYVTIKYNLLSCVFQMKVVLLG
jgi:hypothetical protein